MKSGKPNIIFFFADQQRWDTVGAYGQPLPVTPNLDKMAQDGVLFENAFTCQPVCGPARACLQTGKYATEIGCFTNNRMLPLQEKTIAQHFSENGYEVGYIGKWHLASFGPDKGPDSYRELPVPPERRGGYKDFWLASDTLEFTSHGYDGFMFDADGNKKEFPEGRFRADAQTDWVLDYLKTRDGKKPFFLFLSYIEPHHQNDHNHYEGPHGSKEKFKNFAVPGDLEGTQGDWRTEYPDYLGCCNSLDANLGRIRETLKTLGMEENTIVMYTSDHGSHFKTRNDEYKRSCHDGCIRIPLVVCGPGFSGGKRIDNMVSLIDLPPTMLAMGTIEPPPAMKGRTIQTALTGTDAWLDEVFLQISESHVGRAIRTKKWKYSVRAKDKNGWSDSGSDSYTEDFLYDLEYDPYERSNLVDKKEYAAVREQLAARLRIRMAEAGETAPAILAV